MIPNGKTKTSLDEFLERRGIEKNNFHLNENSILLQKILLMKGHKIINYNQFRPNFTLNNFYTNQNTKRKIVLNRLQKRTKEYKIFNDYNAQKKNTIYNNFVSNLPNVSKEKEKNKYLKEEKYDNLSINCNIFSDTINSKNEAKKEYIFRTSTKTVNISNESILNRINRNKNDNKYNNSNDSFYNRFFETTYKIRDNKMTNNIFKTDKKIYKKKINTDKFKKKKPLSRNKISLLFQENNNSKENSICNSIDFSIINKGSDNNKSNFLSTTNENFYILSKSTNKANNKTLNKNQIKIRNIKFLNHFIKYCYLYYIIIVKKFFNNLKKIKFETYSDLSHLISNHKNNKLFEEFNKDDFDRETIKNRTSENFFTDGINLSLISAKKNKKDFVYNRRKRISNQNYQTKNLMKILNNSKIENEKNISNYDNTKYIFDNENDKNDKYNRDTDKENINDEKKSPFFNGKNNYSDNYNNDKLNLSKNIMKSNNSEMKDNIIGFIQINNEINPFKIKNSHINFFDEAKNQIQEKSNQQNEEEILSFRQKKSEKNNNQNIFQSIKKIFNTKTKDNKLCIDIKYFSNTNYKQNSNKFEENELNIEKNSFQIYNNKRIKKISMRVKDSRLIKEKEDYIDLNNNENRKNYLYSLSIIKEEDDEKYINDSSLQKKIPLKKIDYYFNLSNNSKLISKTSIEKLIDGEKIIKEEDMDNILEQSSSRYSRNKNKSQEIMVVSNFSSIMRNRINRKENAKSLINGILLLIEFFGNLCFDIRKNSYFKLKMNWKIKKMIYYIKRYALKKSYKIIKNGIYI